MHSWVVSLHLGDTSPKERAGTVSIKWIGLPQMQLLRPWFTILHTGPSCGWYSSQGLALHKAPLHVLTLRWSHLPSLNPAFFHQRHISTEFLDSLVVNGKNVRNIMHHWSRVSLVVLSQGLMVSVGSNFGSATSNHVALDNLFSQFPHL